MADGNNTRNRHFILEGSRKHSATNRHSKEEGEALYRNEIDSATVQRCSAR